jgi:hypothetical protein
VLEKLAAGLGRTKSGASSPLGTAMPSEFEIIQRYFSRPARHALLAGGDDAALLRPDAGAELAVSTDLLLEGRHFAKGADPRLLGHKTLAVNLSDMAAMGATPRWATLAIALPAADAGSAFADGFYAARSSTSIHRRRHHARAADPVRAILGGACGPGAMRAAAAGRRHLGLGRAGRRPLARRRHRRAAPAPARAARRAGRAASGIAQRPRRLPTASRRSRPHPERFVGAVVEYALLPGALRDAQQRCVLSGATTTSSCSPPRNPRPRLRRCPPRRPALTRVGRSSRASQAATA